MSNISKINLYCQKVKLHPPLFQLIRKEGLDHQPLYVVSCTFQDVVEIGEGLSLKAAKENSALKIVKTLNLNHKIKELEECGFVYSIESYNVPLATIWENNQLTEYTITLKRKGRNKVDYKTLLVTIHPDI